MQDIPSGLSPPPTTVPSNSSSPYTTARHVSEQLRRRMEAQQANRGKDAAGFEAALEEIQVLWEELRRSQEEIQTANDELQSSNEELETTNEELQSSNEELQTVNEELRQRILLMDEQ